MVEAFPSPHASASEAQETLVSFRAGKCIVEGTRVSADKRQGVFRLIKGNDGLLHVQWLLWPSKSVEDDLIVMGDARLERVVECTTGRVYALRFTSDDSKTLFWMQEPRSTDDAKLVAKFNKHAGYLDAEENSRMGFRMGNFTPSESAVRRVVKTEGGSKDANASASSETGKRARKEDSGRPGVRFRSPRLLRGQTSLRSVFTKENIRLLCEDPVALAELKSSLPSCMQSDADVADAFQLSEFGAQADYLSECIYTNCDAMLDMFALERFAELYEKKEHEQHHAAQEPETSPMNEDKAT